MGTFVGVLRRDETLLFFSAGVLCGGVTAAALSLLWEGLR
jgi:hypothetical protein